MTFFSSLHLSVLLSLICICLWFGFFFSERRTLIRTRLSDQEAKILSAQSMKWAGVVAAF